MFSKMQTDNHNFKKNVTANEKYVVRKMSLKFQIIALYICFVIKLEPF